MDQAKEMAKIAFEALEDKKGEDVCTITSPKSINTHAPLLCPSVSFAA